MKLLVISQYYYPEQFRINEVCAELVRRGHQVTVLTGRPNYPEGEVYPGYEHLKREEHEGVEILRCQIAPRKQGAVRLAWNYLSYMTRAWFRVGQLPGDFDAVLVYQLSPVTMAVPALRYHKKHGAPVYLYCLDLWPESMRDNIPDTNSLPYRLLTRWCQKLYNGAAKIGVTSPAFQDYLHEICLVPRENITYLPQHGEDMLRWGSLEATDNGVTDFVFMGNVGVAQDLENVAKAVRLIRTAQPFLVHIVGIGPDLENLKKTVAQLGVEDHFRFHGRHPLEKMPDFYRLADGCLLTLYDDTAAGLTIPGKLQGYMSAGKPVIAAIGGGAAQVIAQSGCGLCVQPGKPEELAAIMTQFMEQPSQAARMGKRGREYYEKHFSLDIFTAQLERQLEELCPKRGSYEDFDDKCILWYWQHRAHLHGFGASFGSPGA